jgi:hypothetical protein
VEFTIYMPFSEWPAVQSRHPAEMLFLGWEIADCGGFRGFKECSMNGWIVEWWYTVMVSMGAGAGTATSTGGARAGGASP